MTPDEPQTRMTDYNIKDRAAYSAAKRKALTKVVRGKISNSVRASASDPDIRQRRSAAAKKRWADPEYRARQIAAITKGSRGE